MCTRTTIHFPARIPFKVADIEGDALLRSTSPTFDLYEVVLNTGQIFTLERVKASQGYLWAALPSHDYEPLAELIGQEIEAARA